MESEGVRTPVVKLCCCAFGTSPDRLRKEACRSELQKEKSGTGKNRFFKQSVVTSSFVETVRLPIPVQAAFGYRA